MFIATSNDHVIVGKASASCLFSSTFSITCWYDQLKDIFQRYKIFSSDFFDSSASKPQIDTTTTTAAKPITKPEESSALPEGFFDDPHADARVRKVEYVDKMEVEWDAFTREMKQETNVDKFSNK